MTETTDIVSRLRDMPSIPERRSKIRDEAADEIERLREQIVRLKEDLAFARRQR